MRRKKIDKTKTPFFLKHADASSPTVNTLKVFEMKNQKKYFREEKKHCFKNWSLYKSLAVYSGFLGFFNQIMVFFVQLPMQNLNLGPFINSFSIFRHKLDKKILKYSIIADLSIVSSYLQNLKHTLRRFAWLFKKLVLLR